MDKEPHPARTSVIQLTKKQIAIISVLFALLLIAVGLLAGLIKPEGSSLLSRQSSVSSASNDRPWNSGRLPEHVVPVHYDLTLFPDFYHTDEVDSRFYGNVSILVNITSKSTRHLLLHANQLTIHQTAVRRQSSKTTQDESPRVQRAFNFTRNQYWVVELDRDVQPGSALWIDIQFEGSMIGRLSGLYRTSYIDSRSGQQRYHTRGGS